MFLSENMCIYIKYDMSTATLQKPHRGPNYEYFVLVPSIIKIIMNFFIRAKLDNP